MIRATDLTGKIFGRLLVIGYSHTSLHRKAMWVCKCDCGTVKVTTGSHLLSNRVRSCGCIRMDRIVGNTLSLKHGHHRGYKPSRTYRSWKSMKTRCTNSKHPYYYNYGGRGITVCDRWLNSFETFLADMGERPEGKTLDRYPDPNGNYEPGNCRWATKEQQNSNRRKRCVA